MPYPTSDFDDNISKSNKTPASPNTKAKHKSKTQKQPTKTKEKHDWTLEEVSRIVQPQRLVATAMVYVLFIYSTGNFLLNILIALKATSQSKKVVRSNEDVLTAESLGWTAVITSGIAWAVALATFIWFHIICQQSPDRPNCYRSTLQNCLPF